MNELRNGLFALADEVTHEMTETDYATLYRRVHRTSRRIGRRRTAAAVSVTAVVTGGIVLGGALLFAPRSNNHPNLPAGTPTAGVTAAPAPPPSETASPKPLTAVPGTLLYLSSTTPGQPLKIVAVSNGSRRTTAFGSVKASDVAIVPAPDVSRVAVVTSPDKNRILPGDLVVVDSSGARRTLVHNVRWDGGNWPLWTPDAKKIMVLLDAGWSTVDVTTGQATPQPGVNGQYFVWSDDGAFRAYAPDEHQVAVTRADGTPVGHASLDALPDCQNTVCPFAVQAVSNDGRFVALGYGNTDPSHVGEAHLVLEVQTGKLVDLPNLRDRINEIFFGPDGGLVVRTGTSNGSRYTFYLVGPGGSVQATIPQPADLNKTALVGYHP